jgi:hypothetical protein
MNCVDVKRILCTHVYTGDFDFVRSIASHGIAAGTRSPIGRNAAFLPIALWQAHIGRIGENKLKGRPCLKLYNNKLNIDATDRATAHREIIYVREGLYEFSNSDFNTADAQTLICFTCLLSS